MSRELLDALTVPAGRNLLLLEPNYVNIGIFVASVSVNELGCD